MSVSLQVIYPVGAESTFNHEYYATTHMALVQEYMGPHIAQTLVTKGKAGGPKVPPAFHAIATMVFADADAMKAAMALAGPVMADIPNFTNIEPQILIGDVVA